MGCRPSLLGGKCGFTMTVGCRPRRSHTMAMGRRPITFGMGLGWWTGQDTSVIKSEHLDPPLTPPGAPGPQFPDNSSLIHILTLFRRMGP